MANQRQFYDRLYQAPGAGQRDAQTWAEAQELKWQLFLQVRDRHTSGIRRVVEIGCGTGLFCRRVAEEGMDIIGIDVSNVAIEQAKARCSDLAQPPRFVCGDASTYSLPQPTDAVFAFDVVEHMTEAQVANLLCNVRRCLAPRASLVLTTPNRLRPGNRIRSILGLKPSKYEAHEREYSRPELEALLRGAGFTTTMVRGTHIIAPGYTIGSRWMHWANRRLGSTAFCPGWTAAELEWVCRI